MGRCIDDDGILALMRGKPLYVGDNASDYITLERNRHYTFGEILSLTILGLQPPVDDGPYNQRYQTDYSFDFDSGEIPTTLSLPNEIIWQEEPAVAAFRHYEVSIRCAKGRTGWKYYGLMTEWEIEI